MRTMTTTTTERAEGNGAQGLARALGYFSVGLGLAEVVAPGALGRWLGMEDRAGVLRAYGLRELAAGAGILAGTRRPLWVWSRVGGDALDLATLASGLKAGNPRRGNVMIALAAVAGITALDVLCGARLRRR